MKGVRLGGGGGETVKVGWEEKRNEMMKKVQIKGGEREVETRKKGGNKSEGKRNKISEAAMNGGGYWRREIKRRERGVRREAEMNRRVKKNKDDGEGEREMRG